MKKYLAMMLFAAIVCAVSAQNAADKEADGIRSTAQLYVDSFNNRDPKGIAAAFHPVAVLYSAGRNGLSEYPRWKWVESLEKNPNKPADWIPYTAKISVLDMTETTAVAKVELDNPKEHYVDYLSMVKLDGKWRIVGKVYHFKDKKPLPS